MGEVRLRKINKLIMRYVGEILSKDIDIDTPAMITVKKVDTSDDLSYTNVWISVMPEQLEEETMQRLSERIAEIQKTLNRKMSIKFVPWIRFKLDKSEQKAANIRNLIERATHNE